MVHGDDFLVLAPKKVMDTIEAKMRNKYKIEAQHINPEEGVDQQIVMLNRVITWRADLKLVEYEADYRHVEKVITAMGVNDKRALKVPITHDELKGVAQDSEELGENEKKRYRSVTARLNYLAADRADIAFSIKTASQKTQSPNGEDYKLLTRVAQYLTGG